MNHLSNSVIYMPNEATGIVYEPVFGELMVWDHREQIELTMDRQDLLEMGWKLIRLGLSLEVDPDEDDDSGEGEYK